MTRHHLLSAQYSETAAVRARPDFPFPLAEERIRSGLVRPFRERLTTWTRSYLLRGPPWQEVVDHQLEADFPVLLLERFAGLTFADVVRNLSAERWKLPNHTWLFLAQQLFDAAQRGGEHWLREPPCPAGIGWTITGELMLAPVALNTIWATSRDVPDHSVCFAPEHLDGAPLGERTAVFQLALLLVWLSCGEHPFGPVGTHLCGMEETPIWRSCVARSLVPILERALRRSPTDRFATLDDFRHALFSEAGSAFVTRNEAFSVLQAVTHRLVDRLVAELWAHDEELPACWDGLWPAELHPLEGLAVVEDGLLERRVDRRSLTHWNDSRPTRVVALESSLAAATSVGRVDALRWWSSPL